MEAANRWETEAIRESRARRRRRPAVSQDRTVRRSLGEWVTLREASDATGIPINTLRKWCRHETVDSYLESDGELTLRIVELASIRQHAGDLGRDVTPRPEHGPEEAAEVPATDTMIVPVDAWNKMLTQLGNLHEAGQQLAEARERAAKAETESEFLRERLAELRAAPVPPTALLREPSVEPPPVPPIEDRGDPEPGGTERSDAGGPSGETVSFFR
jgi:hypothetical protein